MSTIGNAVTTGAQDAYRYVSSAVDSGARDTYQVASDVVNTANTY